MPDYKSWNKNRQKTKKKNVLQKIPVEYKFIDKSVRVNNIVRRRIY